MNLQLFSIRIAVLLAATPLAFAADPITVSIYSTYTSGSPDGSPFSGLEGTFTVSSINFPNVWNPLGIHPAGSSFGADLTSAILVGTGGSETFMLNSDDGARLYVDGSLVVDDGGAHGPADASGSVTLTPGVHQLEVKFFECCGPPSQLTVTLPRDVSYTTVPESRDFAVVAGAGLAAFALIRRRLA